MKNRTLFTLSLVVGFVGASSCGDNGNSAKDMEIAALRGALAARNNQQTVNTVSTVVATQVVNITQTAISTSSSTTGTATTVVYTVTSTGTGTGTGVSSSTATATRQ